jgi:hypothetical protein
MRSSARYQGQRLSRWQFVWALARFVYVAAAWATGQFCRLVGWFFDRCGLHRIFRWGDGRDGVGLRRGIGIGTGGHIRAPSQK